MQNIKRQHKYSTQEQASDLALIKEEERGTVHATPCTWQTYADGGGARNGIGTLTAGIEGIGGSVTLGMEGMAGIGGTVTLGTTTAGIGAMDTLGMTMEGIGGMVTLGTEGRAGIGGRVTCGTVTAGTVGIAGIVTAGTVGTAGIGGRVGMAGTAGRPGTAAAAGGEAAGVVSAKWRAPWHVWPPSSVHAMITANKLKLALEAIAQC
ncbi:hypothetical protein D1007_28297 [Hordeum vulgare]|nr:hypothetical protein D1007_28297 [Hordeum vulgare]